MKFTKDYRGHKFITNDQFGYYNYVCDVCKIKYHEKTNDYTIWWSDLNIELFNEDTVLTCDEVQIKRLLE